MWRQDPSAPGNRNLPMSAARMYVLDFTPPVSLKGGFQMKIAGGHGLANLDAYIKNVRDREKTQSFSGTGSCDTIAKDEVVLSPEAKQIQQAKELIASLPDIREEKVAEIRARIEAGEYQIDGEKIAEKMIEESLLNELI
jgi:negative regulator of flagellin synthesis FlgM